MAGQEQVARHQRDEEEPPAPTPTPAPSGAAADFAVDSLLDEIDGVLEVNAETFVRGFVQKGGQ